MLEAPRSVLVVGASVAGVHAVEQLRLAGFGGRVILAGEESEQPYDRRPLSKPLLACQMASPPVLLDDAAHLVAVTLFGTPRFMGGAMGMVRARLPRDDALATLSSAS
jgi:hypothetical protein